ncbi:MAG: response regulator [Cellulomonas sp.]|nr:response regulator [Cellulomonas sp.]
MPAAWSRRILLVEDQKILRLLVARSLREAGFEVSDHPDAASALAAAEDFDADVLVTDIDLGSRPDGTQLAVILRAAEPELVVVFLTNYPRAAAQRGDPLPGATYLGKDALGSADDLVATIDAAVRTGYIDTPDLDDSSPLAALSRSQLEVLALIAEGHSNDEIARRTDRTTRAVERLVARTFDRLGLANHPSTSPRVLAAQLYTRTFGPRGPDAG